MSAVSATLERRALSLGTANAIDYALQFLLPMVLTRTLDPHSFGEYRLLWLAVTTSMYLAPLCMPESLYYFLPRSDRLTQRLYINQAMVFVAITGVLAAWVLSEWNPFLPGALGALVNGQGAVVPAFVLLWLFATVLDVLPTAEERVAWQAKIVVSLSAVRAVALSLAAFATHELAPVLWTLLAFAGLKATLLLYYVSKNHGLAGPVVRRETLAAQLRQAAPFAVSGTLHGLRSQGDQWIAAALFSMAMFASFSVATVLGPLVQIFRKSVNHVFLPSMSRLQSSGDIAAMLGLNSRANAMVAVLVYPMLAFAFVFADSIITLIYTKTYLDAVPVMRLYILALLAFVVEVVSILFVLNQGSYAARVNGIVLVVALPLSYVGAVTWGLVGAAIGSVAAVYLERFISLHRIKRLTGTPISKLQDWSKLGAILAAAVLAAGVAGVALHWASWHALATIAAGGAVLAVAYPAALCLMGQGAEITYFVAALKNRK